jgi:RNA-binding protein
MKSLEGFQRKDLRAKAHSLKPLIQIGQAGLSEGLLASFDETLLSRELVKVRFLAFKESRKEIAAELAELSKAELVGMIGNVAIFYRQNPDEDQRVIKLARRPNT